MLQRKFIVLLILSILTLNGYSQNQYQAELLDDGDFFFNRGEYQEALFQYLQFYKNDTTNANVAFKIGSCYLNMPGSEVLAIPYFEYASQHISFEYNKRSKDERQAPLHTLFYLGNVYRMNDEIDKAIDAYVQFTSSPHYKGNYNEGIVVNEILATERAKAIMNQPIEVEEYPMTDNRINTEAIEQNPVISDDGRHLVFIRRLKFYDAIFYCQKINDSTWSEPRNINGEIGSDGNHYPTSFSFNGDKLLLIENKDFNKDVYYTTRKNGRWQPLTSFGKEINSRANENFASLSADGKKMLITSDRWGGEGALDIYIAELDKNNQWSEPENLGELVNTKFNEATAYFTNNDSTIVFGSQGHLKIGGYDIFYSNRLKDGSWSNPVNIGYPVNTTSNNLYYQPFKNGKKLIYSKYDIRTENEDVVICDLDKFTGFIESVKPANK